jgi:hypothetical protein
MVFGEPGLRQRFPAYRLDKRGLMLARMRGDASLVAEVESPASHSRSRTASRERTRSQPPAPPPTLPLLRVAADGPPQSDTKATAAHTSRFDGHGKLDANRTARLMRSLVPPPPIPRPPPRQAFKSGEATKQDEVFADHFHTQGCQRHDRAMAAADKKAYPASVPSPVIRSEGELAANVDRLHYRAVAVKDSSRLALDAKYLKARQLQLATARSRPATAK